MKSYIKREKLKDFLFIKSFLLFNSQGPRNISIQSTQASHFSLKFFGNAWHAHGQTIWCLTRRKNGWQKIFFVIFLNFRHFLYFRYFLEFSPKLFPPRCLIPLLEKHKSRQTTAHKTERRKYLCVTLTFIQSIIRHSIWKAHTLLFQGQFQVSISSLAMLLFRSLLNLTMIA